MNGVLLVDKASGPTSHDVVHQVRKALGIRGIGHAGTLDPMASGLLVLLVGEATKISDYILNGDKAYRVGVRLGLRTDSYDLTGEVLEDREVSVTETAVREALASLTGEIELEVPKHSAVKVDGRKLYERAHRGEEIESLPKRVMRFDAPSDLRVQGRELSFHVQCSKGSYIRALAHALGERLGVGGTLSSLRRTLSAPFELSDAVSVPALTEAWEARDQRDGRVWGSAWIRLADALPGFRRVDLDGQGAYLLRNGQISRSLQAELLRFIQVGETPPPVRVVHRESKELMAILLAEPGQFYRIRRVFNA